MGQPLAGFMRACQQARDEADQLGYATAGRLCKAMAVSLVGKLHSYDECWEECQPDYNDPIAGSWLGPDGRGETTEYHALAGSVRRRVRQGLSAHAIPEIALWIWSLGRNWLWERMTVAGLENVLYADTDGLIVSGRGFGNLHRAGGIREQEWGELRLVTGPVEVEILGPKMLRIGDEIICAGAPKQQRSSGFADAGYWYRRPLGNAPESYRQGVFEEEYRERGTATR